MLGDWQDTGQSTGSRQRTIHRCRTRGAARHPQGRNAVEQPRSARLDASEGGAPQGNVNYRFWHLTFHSRSSGNATARLSVQIPGRIASMWRGEHAHQASRRGRRHVQADW
jgi:hypothetical protein